MPAIRRLALFLAHCAAAGRPIAEIAIKLVANKAMVQANIKHMGLDDITDVISFPHAPMPGEERHALRGDIIVNAQLAMQEGATRGCPAHELALYIAHGLDHLAGGTDSTPASRQKMRRRELAWLKKARKAGLLPPRQQAIPKKRAAISTSQE